MHPSQTGPFVAFGRRPRQRGATPPEEKTTAIVTASDEVREAQLVCPEKIVRRLIVPGSRSHLLAEGDVGGRGERAQQRPLRGKVVVHLSLVRRTTVSRAA